MSYQATITLFLDSQAEIPTLEEMKIAYVKHVLAQYGGNKSVAARVLDIDRGSIHRYLKGRSP